MLAEAGEGVNALECGAFDALPALAGSEIASLSDRDLRSGRDLSDREFALLLGWRRAE